MSEADIDRFYKLLKNIELILQGREFDRLTTSNTPTDNDKTYYAVTAVDGVATLGSDTTTLNEGDSPEGDDIQQDQTMSGEFSEIDVTTGVVYAYY